MAARVASAKEILQGTSWLFVGIRKSKTPIWARALEGVSVAAFRSTTSYKGDSQKCSGLVFQRFQLPYLRRQ
jgi:hypothetical protein